jgi:predicted Rossmann fold nucleotide-binding protein DprA/Smf involved in DNA uptake
MTKSEAKKYRKLLDAELEYEAEVYCRSLEGAAWHRANGDAKRAKALEDRARVVLDEAMEEVAAVERVEGEPMLTLQDLHRAERIAARRGARLTSEMVASSAGVKIGAAYRALCDLELTGRVRRLGRARRQPTAWEVVA